MYIKFIKNKIVRTNKPHLTSVYVLRWYIFSKYFLTAVCLHSVESPVASNSHAIASTVHEYTLVGINYVVIAEPGEYHANVLNLIYGYAIVF